MNHQHLNRLSFLFITALLIMTGCNQTIKQDDSFIEFLDTTEAKYYMKKLSVYPDSLAVLTTWSNGKKAFWTYRLVYQDSTGYKFQGINGYKSSSENEQIKNFTPGSLTAIKNGNKWNLTGDGIHIPAAEYKYHKDKRYYDNAHVIHHKTKNYIVKEQRLLAQKQSADDTAEPIDSDGTPVITKNPKYYSKNGVPIRPDFSSGRIEGTTNNFKPQNYTQFVEYNLAMILATLSVISIIMIFLGRPGYTIIGYRRKRSFTPFFKMCFMFTLAVTVFEIKLFYDNPYVLFQSDFPLFGCLGRVATFLILCMLQSKIIKWIKLEMDDRYNITPIRHNWIFTLFSTASVITAFIAVLSGIQITAPIQLTPNDITGAAFVVITTSGLIQLLIKVKKNQGITWYLFIYYLIIYPWSMIQLVAGGAFALLGKIAREAPDNDFEKAEDPDHRYVTDALGNGAYLTRIGDNRWQDNNGNMFSGTSNGFSRQKDNHMFY